tara:strand:- start:1271 stop:2353 length:1083 start_codon:yes stop_codon:yes gene_type:complete
MELQNFIQNNDYISEFKKLKLSFRKYSKLGLLIVKTYQNNNCDYETYPWMKYCRGAVIDIINHKLVCIPPMKSEEKEDLDEIIDGYDSGLEYQPLVDGTMINVFYHNDEWFVSTRSNIGAKNSWDGKISFNRMFEEVVGKEFYSNLDKECCYSFVLQHTKNRIISPIEENKVYLVEKYKLGEKIERCVEFEEIVSIEKIFSFDSTYLKNYTGDLFFSIKGFTIKGDGVRYKWINPNYKYVEGIKMNNNNKFLSYMELRQKWLLNEYLCYFPEERHLFNSYRDKITYVKDLIYSSYVRYRIKKEIDIKEVEYCLRPIMGELHDFYKKNSVKITQKYVSSFVNKLDGKKLIFIINRITDSKV